MGLRCLIGHDFGEVQTDREREERGDEEVVTVREYRECDRCGEHRVLSENKEVRTTATPERAADDDREGRDGSPAEPGGDPANAGPAEDVSADEDDGVILEEGSEADRGRGEWPEEADEAPDDEPSDDDPAPWPDVEGEDEGYAAEPSEGGGAEGVDFGGGLTPEAATGGGGGSATEASNDADDAEDVLETTGDRGSSGIRRARPSPEPTDRQHEATGDTEFYCPECEHAAPSDGSSLRPGDICPECGLGYLTERAT